MSHAGTRSFVLFLDGEKAGATTALAAWPCRRWHMRRPAVAVGLHGEGSGVYDVEWGGVGWG